MATNITVNTIDNCAVLYFQDGTTGVIEPHSEKSFQLVDMGFVTISEAADPDSSEHPDGAPEFVEKMIAFWQKAMDEIKNEIQDPTATPV